MIATAVRSNAACDHHRQPDTAREREDRPEQQPGDRRLLGPCEPLVRIVHGREQCGREQHHRDARARPVPEQFAEPIEQEAAIHEFLAKARDDDRGEDHPRQCARVSRQGVIRGVDHRRAEQRHHDRLHRELEHDPEHSSAEDRDGPVPGPDEPEIAPRLVGRARPDEDQGGDEQGDHDRRNRLREGPRRTWSRPWAAESSPDSSRPGHRRRRTSCCAS